ncbi:MAG: DinB family protein [Candidatus Eisenbacteria bacterium]
MTTALTQGISMTAARRQELIQRYADGVRQVEEALEGFPERLIGERPFPGKWTAREIVHHLADSETTSAFRLRKLLVEDHPLIQGYDQEAFAVKLRYNERTDLKPSLEAFRNARVTTLQVIAGMTDADWKRVGWHTESGVYTIERWLEIYAAHAHGHADQIRRLKQALAK